MNVVLRALIRPVGIRSLVRPHGLRNLPSRFSSSGVIPNDPSSDQLSSNPYSVETQWQTAAEVEVEEDVPQDDPFLTSDSNEFVALIRALRPVTSLAEMQRISQHLGIAPDKKHFTFVINNCLRIRDTDEAFALYHAMKETGIKVDPELAQSFFRWLSFDNVTATVVDRALEIYQDVIDANPPRHSENPAKGIGGFAPYHYGRLFRLILSSPDQEKHLPIIDSLIEDMRSSGLSTNHSSVATTKIILEMRKKQLFADALEVYRQNRDYLNEFGFFEILQEYCRISFVGALDVPLITQYFSIVNDMRLRKMIISPHIYGLIIKHICVMATKIKRGQINGQGAEAQERLISTIRRVHDFLTLDASFSPNAVLLNQLLDAYQRLECFGDAYRLWEMMFLTGRYGQITVTIMLDACGYSGQYRKARTIIRKLERAGFKMDLRNWNTWVECLCRLGRFDEALDVAFVQMGKNGKKPDITTVMILEKFARRDNLPHDFLARVETDFPRLWDSLQGTIQNS